MERLLDAISTVILRKEIFSLFILVVAWET